MVVAPAAAVVVPRGAPAVVPPPAPAVVPPFVAIVTPVHPGPVATPVTGVLVCLDTMRDRWLGGGRTGHWQAHRAGKAERDERGTGRRGALEQHRGHSLPAFLSVAEDPRLSRTPAPHSHSTSAPRLPPPSPPPPPLLR